MDINVYKVSEVSDEKIHNLLSSNQSFVLKEVKHMKETVKTLKTKLDKLGVKYKVYTKGRVAGVALIAAPVALPAAGVGAAVAGLTCVAAGLGAAAGVTGHNIKNRKAVYKIGKNPLKKTITVTCKVK
ncbi:hypothetical protein PDESU_00412 [Pontiella desulfatans]|uniref:Uncharacterized protein n=1 Tax=Pontiella desulfatans TaxID=2750659 RepID=A0A6C2TW16_PONDE|nr:hypothetical protein [Pontiella desulfatans]VGO11865.1 hypothetical protein PDESU_00412 [Pontiella desulfatans]